MVPIGKLSENIGDDLGQLRYEGCCEDCEIVNGNTVEGIFK